MNCHGFEAVLPELARENLGDETVRRQALEHALSCPHCARHLTEERELTKLFRLASSEPAVAPPSIEAALISAFRDRQARPRRSTSGWFHFQRFSLVPVGVAIAAVGLLITVAEMEMRHFARPAASRAALPKAEGAREAASPTVTKESALTRLAEQAQQAPAVGRAMPALQEIRPQATVPQTGTVPAEIATDFIALTSAAQLSSMESGQLVRVLLPRSALAYYGLPFNQELADKPVAAQVLIGQDGVARAIRFLREPDARMVQTGLHAKR